MLKAISLFAGMGGDTQGIEDAGIDVVAFSENNKSAIESHLVNFPNSVSLGDVTSISEEDLKPYIGIDLIFAGFPCQGFSNAGKKLPEDPRNTMFREFARIVSIVKPKAIIGENVKGLLSRKTHNGLNFIDVITDEFKNLGYNIKYGLLEANEHGVPQKRQRLFIVGTLADNPIKTEIRNKKPYISLPKDDEIGLRDLLEFSMDGAVSIDPAVFDFSGVNQDDVVTDMSNDETETVDANKYIKLKMSKIPIHQNEKNGKKTNPLWPYHYYNKDTDRYEYDGKTFASLFSYGKRDSPVHCEVANVNKPTKTIICTYASQPRVFVPLKNSNGYYIRPFTVKELLQIQSFPKDFVVIGSYNSQVSQIGNAVPPRLCEKLVKEILPCLG